MVPPFPSGCSVRKISSFLPHILKDHFSTTLPFTHSFAAFVCKSLDILTISVCMLLIGCLHPVVIAAYDGNISNTFALNPSVTIVFPVIGILGADTQPNNEPRKTNTNINKCFFNDLSPLCLLPIKKAGNQPSLLPNNLYQRLKNDTKGSMYKPCSLLQ